MAISFSSPLNPMRVEAGFAGRRNRTRKLAPIDAFDEEDPSPSKPSVLAIKVLGDTVGDQAIKGTGDGRHGEEDSTACC